MEIVYQYRTLPFYPMVRTPNGLKDETDFSPEKLIVPIEVYKLLNGLLFITRNGEINGYFPNKRMAELVINTVKEFECTLIIDSNMALLEHTIFERLMREGYTSNEIEREGEMWSNEYLY